MLFLRICLFLSFFWAPLRPVLAQSEAVYEEAVALLNAEKFGEAKAKFDAILKKNPAHTDALYSRGIAQMALATGGFPDYSNAQNSVPPEKLNGAIQDFTRVLELAPNDAHALAMRGLCFKVQEKWPQAQRDLNRAAQIDPQFADVAANLQGTRGTRLLWPAIFVVMGVLSLLALRPFLRSLQQLSQAEKNGRG